MFAATALQPLLIQKRSDRGREQHDALLVHVPKSRLQDARCVREEASNSAGRDAPMLGNLSRMPSQPARGIHLRAMWPPDWRTTSRKRVSPSPDKIDSFKQWRVYPHYR